MISYQDPTTFQRKKQVAYKEVRVRLVTDNSMNSKVNGACLQNSEGKGRPDRTVVCLSNRPVSWKVKLVIL